MEIEYFSLALWKYSQQITWNYCPEISAAKFLIKDTLHKIVKRALFLYKMALTVL